MAKIKRQGYIFIAYLEYSSKIDYILLFKIFEKLII